MDIPRRTLLQAAILAACIALGLPAPAAAASGPLRVVTTLPDLADVARRIGGDRVEVTSLTKGRENLHHVVARPSHLVALSRADVLVQVGLSLEMGFLPGLLENANNPKIRPGSPGFVSVSVGWSALNIPTVVSRKDGDVHPDGNPHLNLDPRGGRQIAERILAGLVAVDPEGQSAYETRAAQYRKELDAAEARWDAAAKDWSGKKIVVYHMEYDYLARRYGLEIVGTIETKPGIPPTPGHIAELVEKMKSAGSVVILTAPWSNSGEVEQIAKATGAQVVELPNQCGGIAGTDTWIGMQDLMHERLARAFGTAAPKR
ncbi:MAG: metal ABC transporter substrate-binding protein [Planctomycetota bacterium]|nr:metal ABC transporter substrate-binding protein [Planctomycetota bacterium]